LGGQRLGYAARMVMTKGNSRSPCAARLAVPIGIGVVAGFTAAAGVLFGRKAVIQPKYPLDAMSTYLNGFHMYADEMGRQVEATHFCIHLRPDLHQCVIFDRNAPDARLIGIEYITTEEYFRSLPED